jgi:hypothetical protein
LPGWGACACVMGGPCNARAGALLPPRLQVRALQSTPFGSDPASFATMAEASIALAQSYLDLVTSGAGAGRDLASARMLLRSVLRQAQERFEQNDDFERLNSMLQKVGEMEGRLKARPNASPAPAAL